MSNVMRRSQPRRPQSVQVFLVRQLESIRSYLLLHRNAMPRLGLPAFWQGVTGALEPGESFLDAALREVREETAIQLATAIAAQFSQRFPIRPEWRGSYGEGPTEVEEQVFYAFVPEAVLPALSAEHQAWRWCTYGEAEQLLTFGANKECLQAVERHIASSPAHNTSIERTVVGKPPTAVHVERWASK